MAVDTRDERASAVMMMLPFGRLLPHPNGGVSAADRAQTAYSYAGFLMTDTGSGMQLFGLGFGITLWGFPRFRRGAAIWHGGGGR